MPPPIGVAAGIPGTGGAGGVAPEAGRTVDPGGVGGTGGVPPPADVDAGVPGVGGTGGVAPEEGRISEPGGVAGTGGVPPEDEVLAGGRTTGGAGCPGFVNDRAVSVNACGMSPGREITC